MFKWDEESIAILKIEYKKGTSPKDIAIKLSTTVQSVKYKASSLGITKKHKYTLEDYLKIFKEVHGSKYDYSKSNYKDRDTKISIYCKECKEYFLQTPHDHRNGRGCPVCAQKQRIEKQRYDELDIIEKFHEKHGLSYSYESLEYTGLDNTVYIQCLLHGEFTTTPRKHLRGTICPACKDSKANPTQLSRKEFLQKAKTVHGDKYDYSKLVYKGLTSKVTILCHKHGKFRQKASNHIYQGSGCPKCKISYPHARLLGDLENLNIGEIIANDRKILEGKELDIYIPKYNLAVEINGLYWHRLENVGTPLYHENKFRKAEEKGLTLLQFWGTEIRNQYPIVLSMVKSKLGITKNKYYARKLSLSTISQKEFSTFLEGTHIQGKVTSGLRYGLFSDQKLVAVMGFNHQSTGNIELVRFSSLLNTTVVGGFSKLLQHAIVENSWSGKHIISFSDNSYGRGHVYEKNGFTHTRTNRPRLFYTDTKSLYNRRNFQKKNMIKKYPDLSKYLPEKEMARSKGYHQIYGCGTKKWELYVT